MLDSDTKRRIDTARDILVGKVPDPKSQVEQITIALIYKFMDDMDAEAEELGGKRSFFAGAYARYGWAKLMRSGLGGHEMLALYAEAITKMPENPGIPALFRDIFKNAYLPYRDPETLRAFLKIIDEFSYDHSERLGDAFEYLLSVLGSQGDAGQFRTPRHIIDFMVELIDPRKDETVLDPACGTAGFLISSFKHILRKNRDAKGHSTLTPDDRARIAKNFKGYDISPDMVRLSLVNLYLHGFTDPHVFEYDTLTSEERWNEFADVILANPPFMSPKGGIKPHKRFSIQAKRSEVLFVDYMAEHLTPKGRAAIIVPEGIIFQSQTAYKELREMLVKNSLVAVISLPAGCFNPYSGVKTSILILDKALAKQADTVAFFKVENDGFGLGAQRRAINANDLPQVLAETRAYVGALRSGSSVDATVTTGMIVPKEKLAANGEYNLSGERYREGAISNTAHPLVPVGRFMKAGVKTIDPRNHADEVFELWSIPAFDAGSPELQRGGEIGSQKKAVFPNEVLLSRIVPHIRRGWVVRENSNGLRQIASTEWIVFSGEEIVPDYLKHVLVSDPFHASFMQTITGVGGSLSRANPGAVAEIQIPLPPLAVQQEIVTEIEGYQKVIDGARAVLDHYRPHIPINPEWPMVELGEVCDLYQPKTITGQDLIEDGPYLVFGANGVIGRYNQYNHEEAEVLITCRGATCGTINKSEPKSWVTGNAMVAKPKDDRLSKEFLFSLLKGSDLGSTISGSAQPQITRQGLAPFLIPLPPLATQQAIVAEIEAERALVAANRELIARFEKKIQATLARVWGEPEALDCGSLLPLSTPQPAAESHWEAHEKPRASRLAPEKRQQAAAVQDPVPAPVVEQTPADEAPSSRPTHPDELDKSDLMALFRDLLNRHGPTERQAVIRLAAAELGYQRLSEKVSTALDNALVTAVRRWVLINYSGVLSVFQNNIAEYNRKHLKSQLLAAVSEHGRVWMEREDAIRAFPAGSATAVPGRASTKPPARSSTPSFVKEKSKAAATRSGGFDGVVDLDCGSLLPLSAPQPAAGEEGT